MDSNEIIRQIGACESFLKINMIYEESDIYIDIGFSGRSNKRPILSKMIEKAISSDLDMILVDSWNILSTSPFGAYDIYHYIKDYNKNFKLYSISEGGLEINIIVDRR